MRQFSIDNPIWVWERRIVFIMNKIQRVEQQQLWMSRISDLASSGLTQSQWCQEKGFSVSTLRYWMRKLREPEEQDSTNWLQVDIPEDGHVASLPVSSNAAPGGLKITCGKYTVEFPSGYDVSSMAAVLKLLSAL